MKRYIKSVEASTNNNSEGKYSTTINDENSYHWLAYYPVLTKVLGKSVCNTPIVIDSFTKDKKDQGDYDRDYNYWRKFSELNLDENGDTCEVSIPAGTPFVMKSADDGSNIDIFISSSKTGPVVTVKYSELADYAIEVSTNALGDKLGDLMEKQNPKADFSIGRLRQFCELISNIEQIFGVKLL